MDGSDWFGLIYCVVAIGAFPFLVRHMWKDELDRGARSYRRYTPSLGLAGITGLALSVAWPLILFFWVCMKFLKLITIGIKDD